MRSPTASGKQEPLSTRSKLGPGCPERLPGNIMNHLDDKERKEPQGSDEIGDSII